MQVCELKSDVLVAGVCEAEGQIGRDREIHACYQYRWCHDWLMSVREARSGDEHDLAIVRVRSWQQGYAGIVDAEYLASLSVEENAVRWSNVLEHQGGSQRILVFDNQTNAELPSCVVGYSTFGPYRIAAGDDKTLEIGELATPGTIGEIYGFYVHPDHWGSQVANELMDATLSALIDDEWPTARLWVLKDNGRARRFYERHGWHVDGAEAPLSVGGNPLELRYRRNLEPNRID
jgi:ribosomal protein S18 acetylase RimI-like enzyme